MFLSGRFRGVLICLPETEQAGPAINLYGGHGRAVKLQFANHLTAA